MGRVVLNYYVLSQELYFNWPDLLQVHYDLIREQNFFPGVEQIHKHNTYTHCS